MSFEKKEKTNQLMKIYNIDEIRKIIETYYQNLQNAFLMFALTHAGRNDPLRLRDDIIDIKYFREKFRNGDRVFLEESKTRVSSIPALEMGIYMRPSLAEAKDLIDKIEEAKTGKKYFIRHYFTCKAYNQHFGYPKVARGLESPRHLGLEPNKVCWALPNCDIKIKCDTCYDFQERFPNCECTCHINRYYYFDMFKPWKGASPDGYVKF